MAKFSKNCKTEGAVPFPERVTKVSLYILLKQQELWEEEGEQEQNKRCQILSGLLYIIYTDLRKEENAAHEGEFKAAGDAVQAVQTVLQELPEILMTPLHLKSKI